MATKNFDNLIKEVTEKLPLIKNDSYPYGLPGANEGDIDFIKDLCGIECPKEAKTILLTLYKYDKFSGAFDVACPWDLRNFINEAFNTYGVPKKCIPFAEINGDYFVFRKNKIYLFNKADKEFEAESWGYAEWLSQWVL